MITGPTSPSSLQPDTTPSPRIESFVDLVNIKEESERLRENRVLLQSITSYIVKDCSPLGEEVANAILSALLPLARNILSPFAECMGFSELMPVMAMLAGSGSGMGHATLLQAACDWLEQW